MTLAGLLVGMLASLQAGRLLTSLLFGVEPRDAVMICRAVDRRFRVGNRVVRARAPGRGG